MGNKNATKKGIASPIKQLSDKKEINECNLTWR